MIWTLVFYWIVCGIWAVLNTPYRGDYFSPGADFILCLVLGGIAVPVRLLRKAMR